MRKKRATLVMALLLLISSAQAMTRDEMRANYDNVRSVRADASPYAEQPSVGDGVVGTLSDEALNAALAQLNFLRALAGLDAVSLNELYTLRCRQAALVLATNDVLSHTPEQPDGMDDGAYASAALGAAGSNIASFNWTRDDILIDGVNYFARDDGDMNLATLAHRRWLLNPRMGETGFGLCNAESGTSYVVMYAVDTQNEADWDYVAWPCAETFPVELMEHELAWSISVNDAVYDLDASAPRVTLTELGSGARFEFDLSTGSGDGYCAISREDYGSGPCLIFRPDIEKTGIEEYTQNQRWQVQVTGLARRDGGAAEIEYVCEMASLYPQAVASIEMSVLEAALAVGDTLYLTANVIPAYADDLSVIWSSDDEDVATVDDSGHVRAVAAGECEICATSSNGRYDICRVTVK